eukprot:9532616-Prorocentrum_lima.AAC.1
MVTPREIKSPNTRRCTLEAEHHETGTARQHARNKPLTDTATVVTFGGFTQNTTDYADRTYAQTTNDAPPRNRENWH